MPDIQKDTLQLVQDDPWLEPYEGFIKERYHNYINLKETLAEKASGKLYDFASAHHYLGINYDPEKKGWWYREWAPNAHALYLIGDFNYWDRSAHPLEKRDDDIWEIFLPDDKYGEGFVHGSRVKVHVVGDNGNLDRIPAYIKRVVQDPESYDFAGQVWYDPQEGNHSLPSFKVTGKEEPFIYEAHTGMAQEEEKVGTYKEFKENVLPRIEKAGYNVIQLMAVMEHPYYGSFGYHVSNFFAPSSRFGDPDDLRDLISEAHRRGIAVVMDLVHSHAVDNIAEGLNRFDGSEGQYFHAGEQGYHPGWDSLLFNYGKEEVLQFLLSNLRYWLEEFGFDGFRFDGVTSMMYYHRGYTAFDHYDKYFVQDVDEDAVNYLQLASDLIKQIRPDAYIIAEDMSGMPGLCREHEAGGIGFDYRLGMGIPDYWIKVLKHYHDEEWDINEMWNVLNDRRYKEKTVAYAESHDQALVGDKTIAFRLMDQDMYFYMKKGEENLIIDRGVALHKMIRLATISLGGEAWLNFMGNEFGHPEWLDFPREGNNFSYKYARRQWSLVDNPELKYQELDQFDKDMVALMKDDHVLKDCYCRQLNMDMENNIMVFERGGLIFLFNFHVDRSIFDYQFPVPWKGAYKIVLNSDDKKYGGFNRVDDSLDYETFSGEMGETLSLYMTNRTALVLKKQ